MSKKNVVILGGAGFIGSNIANKFVNNGWNVSIIDGFFPLTGANIKNLDSIINRVKLIKAKIEEINDIKSVIKDESVIIDAMGWTAHNSAFTNPKYDIELNQASHLNFLLKLRDAHYQNLKIFYLGSRSQYGSGRKIRITEDEALIPTDIQGIHKTGAESYYRVFSSLTNISVISLRISNCFGKNQPLQNDDIGLIGTLIKDLLLKKTVDIYGYNRGRDLIYIEDLCEIIMKLQDLDHPKYTVFNISGYYKSMENIAQTIINILGYGSYKQKTIPEHIIKYDIGNHKLSKNALKKLISFKPQKFETAICETINYFKESIL